MPNPRGSDASGDELGCASVMFLGDEQFESNELSFMELLSRVELQPIPEQE